MGVADDEERDGGVGASGLGDLGPPGTAMPLVTPEVERPLHRCIQAEAQRVGCVVRALRGTMDHVHLLVELPMTVTIAELVKQVKGASSHFVNQELRPEAVFKWQGSYGAFSVGASEAPRVVAYIGGQKEHHAAGKVVAEWEGSAAE